VSTQLVQIQWAHDNKEKWAITSRNEVREKAAQVNHQPEYIELRTAFEAIFKELRSNVVCGACFGGELDAGRKGHGCCSVCPSLTTTGCAFKPVMCASFARCNEMGNLMGEKLHNEFENINSLWRDLRNKSEKRQSPDYWGTHPYHIDGYINDGKINWNKKELIAMRDITGKLGDLLGKIRLGEFDNKGAETVISEYREKHWGSLSLSRAGRRASAASLALHR
jgi:hypothetical protein